MTHNQKSQLEFTQMFPIYEKHARDVKPRAVLIPEKELAAHSTAVHECLDFMCAWSDVLACLRFDNTTQGTVPRGIYTVTPRAVAASEVLTDGNRTIRLVYDRAPADRNGWRRPTDFECLFMLSDAERALSPCPDGFRLWQNREYLEGLINAFDRKERRDALRSFIDRVDSKKTRRLEVAAALIGNSRWSAVDFNKHNNAPTEKLAEELLTKNEFFLRAPSFTNTEARTAFLRAVGAAAASYPLDATLEPAVRIACARVQRAATIYSLLGCA